MKSFGITIAVAGLLMCAAGCETSTLAVDAKSESEIPAPIKVADAEAYKPSALPDRIILSWTGDPARTQAVTWRTDLSVATGLAEIAVAGDNSMFTRSARQLTSKYVDLESNLSKSRYHTVEFNALSPSTKYAYRVGDGVNWSEWFHFQTASDRFEPFTFVYFGDAQNDVKSLWSRVVREAFSDAPKARFLLHAGDLINRANSDAEWGEWHLAGGWLNATIPNVMTPGNHEYERVGPMKTPYLSNHWKPQFALPENGPGDLLETTYYFDFQGTRLISLNSNEKVEQQVPWLENVLASRDSSIHWTVITFHHPIYSSAKNRENVELRTLWQPIFDKYRVDLVLQGHDHTYARSGLVNSTTGVTAKGDYGTVYVVSVSGPKMYDIGRPFRPEFARVAEDTQLFQIITIDGNELRYQARTATGQPYDGFTLVKKAGEPNQLIEQVPETPTRLRPDK